MKVAKEKEQGLKTTDKGTYVEAKDRVPYAPNNNRLSKKQFIEQERLRREKELKIKEFSAQLEKDISGQQATPVPIESKEEKKPKGRPKKIE